MARSIPAALTTSLLLLGAWSGAALAGDVDAQQAFERLKGLAGTWSGEAQGEGEAEAEAQGKRSVTHEFRLAAAGTVVMETMSPGNPDEMINMYHLDGDELMLTHYCAGGNQPAMRLDREASSDDHLVFDFSGGTSLDPAVDTHIHGLEINFGDSDQITSSFHAYSSGEPVGTMTFHLSRGE